MMVMLVLLLLLLSPGRETALLPSWCYFESGTRSAILIRNS